MTDTDVRIEMDNLMRRIEAAKIKKTMLLEMLSPVQQEFNAACRLHHKLSELQEEMRSFARTVQDPPQNCEEKVPY